MKRFPFNVRRFQYILSVIKWCAIAIIILFSKLSFYRHHYMNSRVDCEWAKPKEAQTNPNSQLSVLLSMKGEYTIIIIIIAFLYPVYQAHFQQTFHFSCFGGGLNSSSPCLCKWVMSDHWSCNQIYIFKNKFITRTDWFYSVLLESLRYNSMSAIKESFLFPCMIWQCFFVSKNESDIDASKKFKNQIKKLHLLYWPHETEQVPQGI